MPFDAVCCRNYERALQHEVVSVMNELKVVRILRQTAKSFRDDRKIAIENVFARGILPRTYFNCS